MKRWLIGVMAVMMTMSLTAYTPTTERQKKRTAQAAEDTREIIPQSTGKASDKVSGPNVMSVAAVSMYHGGDSDSLVQDMDSLDTEGLNAQFLVGKLVEYGVLTQGTKVLSFSTQGKEEDSVGTLDLNQAESAEGVSDEMFLTEVGNTFTEDFELGKLKPKINGGNYQGSSIKQGDNDFLSCRTDYDSVEQIKVVYETASWQRVPWSGLII